MSKPAHADKDFTVQEIRYLMALVMQRREQLEAEIVPHLDCTDEHGLYCRKTYDEQEPLMTVCLDKLCALIGVDPLEEAKRWVSKGIALKKHLKHQGLIP